MSNPYDEGGIDLKDLWELLRLWSARFVYGLMNNPSGAIGFAAGMFKEMLYKNFHAAQQIPHYGPALSIQGRSQEGVRFVVLITCSHGLGKDIHKCKKYIRDKDMQSTL